MLKLIVNATKTAAIVFWLACILSVASVIPSPYASFIIGLGAFVLVAHLLEYLFVKFRFAEPNGWKISFVQTMIFGFTHWLPMLKQPE
jgi:uncharacterized protein YhhL (DUF1145 family)